MKLRLLRNATLKLEIQGRIVLIDPFFAPKGSRPSFTGRAPNPLVELPASPEEILDGVELVIVSHLHADHFDPPGDEDKIRSYGFSDVMPLAKIIDWNGIRLQRREGSHGLGPVVKKMGSVMGFSIKAKNEPAVYWAGDTVLYPAIETIIADTKPEIIIIHPCGARWDGDLITMDAAEAVATCRLAPDAVVIATHMESLDHATVSRDELRRHATEQGVSPQQLLIPLDGETLQLKSRQA